MENTSLLVTPLLVVQIIAQLSKTRPSKPWNKQCQSSLDRRDDDAVKSALNLRDFDVAPPRVTLLGERDQDLSADAVISFSKSR